MKSFLRVLDVKEDIFGRTISPPSLYLEKCILASSAENDNITPSVQEENSLDIKTNNSRYNV